jgi:hypothetical protein
VAVTRLVLGTLLLVLVAANARAQSAQAAKVTALFCPRASPPPVSDWTGRSALVQPVAHGQIALFGESRVGVGHDLQVGLHVAGWAALTPHASLLYQSVRLGALYVSGRLGIAYPSPTLSLLTGKGAGALLPADTKPPQALLFDPGVRASLELPWAQLLTLELALPFAAKFTHTSSPLLDFPFLYPRFAALHTPVTVHLSATAEGVLVTAFRWVGALDTWILPVVKHGFALEPRVGLAWAAERRVTLELGYRASYARYPVGLRFHNIPYFDLRVRF